MYRVPGPNHGVYCSLTERLREELEVIVSTAAHDVHVPNCILYQIQLDPDFNHEVFRIKLSGDGAKFSRCSNFFLVSFAILNLEQHVLSPRGKLAISFVVAAWHCLWTDNHTVAVVKMPECQDARISWHFGNHPWTIAPGDKTPHGITNYWGWGKAVSGGVVFRRRSKGRVNMHTIQSALLISTPLYKLVASLQARCLLTSSLPPYKLVASLQARCLLTSSLPPYKLVASLQARCLLTSSLPPYKLVASLQARCLLTSSLPPYKLVASLQARCLLTSSLPPYKLVASLQARCLLTSSLPPYKLVASLQARCLLTSSGVCT